MGMFDYVNCEYELPKYKFKERTDPHESFQTKDLDCNIHLFRIDKEGNLLFKEKPEGVEEHYDYTGDVEFYDYVHLDEDFRPHIGYLESGVVYHVNYIFEATFINGKLSKLVDKSYVEKITRRVDEVEMWDCQKKLKEG